MEFCRPEYWSGIPSPGDLPYPGIELGSPELQMDPLPTELSRKPSYRPWNSPGQNTGVGSFSLLQGIFPTQGSNLGLPHCRWILYQLSHKGNPSSREDIVKEERQAHSEQVWGQDWRRGIKNESLNGSLCPNNCSCPISYSTFCHGIERQLTGKQICNQRTFLFKNYLNRNSLAVQRLGLRAFTAEGQGTKIPQAMCHSQKAKQITWTTWGKQVCQGERCICQSKALSILYSGVPWWLGYFHIIHPKETPANQQPQRNRLSPVILPCSPLPEETNIKQGCYPTQSTWENQSSHQLSFQIWKENHQYKNESPR